MSEPVLVPSVPLRVSELSLQLKCQIEKEFGGVYVQGEISGCTYHRSGHIYFSLKDEHALLEAICWRGTSLPCPLRDGLYVFCRGKLTLYGARSKYHLIVKTLEPAGQGLLLQKIEYLKTQLAKEGLFDHEKKKKLPPFPRRIGLITSPTGAVIHDMKVRFQARLPCDFLLYPVSVQGPQAVQDILKALAYFHSCHPRPDLLIVARGGGSLEDLEAFSHESLVRAVASSTIPIISAIGHEEDSPLVDFAADVRAPTPTAAAEMVLPLKKDLFERLKNYGHGLHQLLHQRAHLHRLTLAPLSQALNRTVSKALSDDGRILFEKINKAFFYWLDTQRARLGSIQLGLIYPPVAQQAKTLDHFSQLLHQFFMWHLTSCQAQLERYAHELTQLSYTHTLQRGFALIVTPEGEVVRSLAQAEKFSSFTIHFVDGALSVHCDSNKI